MSGQKGQVKPLEERKKAPMAINLTSKTKAPKVAPKEKEPKKQMGLKNAFKTGQEAQKKLEVTHAGVKQVELKTQKMNLKSSPVKQVEVEKVVSDVEEEKENALSGKRKAPQPLVSDDEEEMFQFTKKAKNVVLSSQESEKPVQKRQRLKRQLSEDEDIASNNNIESVNQEASEGMDIEEDEQMTEEQKMMRRFEQTKRLPKGKKLITEEVTEFDAKGYLVTRKV